MLDKKKIKAELKDFSEDAAEAIGEALKENFWKCGKAAWAGFSVIQLIHIFYGGCNRLSLIMQETAT